MTIWKKIANDLINFFYPNLCILCERKLIEGEDQICMKCYCHLPHTHFLPQTNNPVEQLLIDKEKVVQASAYFYFQQGGNVRNLIHFLKYKGNKKIGYLLGRHVALEWKSDKNSLSRIDLIIPLPLHPHKQKKRGYNQSEWISKGIESVLDRPVITDAVRREMMTESQTSKKGYDRWLNVKDIFAITKIQELSGKHILLVDDVITTGSTACACIDALSTVPDIQISFFTLSIAYQ